MRRIDYSIFVLLLLCFFLPVSTIAVTVYVAPVAYIEKTELLSESNVCPEVDLKKAADKMPLSSELSFKLAETRLVPASFLEAARICEEKRYPFVLYGYVERSETTYYAELRLLVRENKRIISTFVGSDDIAHYDRLMSDMARKVIDYFVEDLAIVVTGIGKDPSLNIFGLSIAIGYWSPFGNWQRIMRGTGNAELGLNFIPKYPLGTIGSRPWYLETGLRVEYGMGLGIEGYENFIFHETKVLLPISLKYELGVRNCVGIGVGGVAAFDLAMQEKKYNSTVTKFSTVGGASAFILYQFALSKRVTLGLDCRLDAIFYTDPLLEGSCRVTVNVGLGKQTRNSYWDIK